MSAEATPAGTGAIAFAVTPIGGGGAFAGNPASAGGPPAAAEARAPAIVFGSRPSGGGSPGGIPSIPGGGGSPGIPGAPGAITGGSSIFFFVFAIGVKFGFIKSESARSASTSFLPLEILYSLTEIKPCDNSSLRYLSRSCLYN